MYESEISKEELESVATRLIAKYPDGYLSGPELIRWEGWGVAIRGPDADGLDSPKAIIRGSYMEIRAFEIAYHRIRGRAKSSPLIVDGRVAMEAQNGSILHSRRGYLQFSFYYNSKGISFLWPDRYSLRTVAN